MKRIPTALLALLALAALLCSCSTLEGAPKQEATVVSVTGDGIVYLDADMVKFSINVNETADTTAEAQQKTNKKMTQILDILKKHGTEDNDISTTALNFNSEYYWDDGKQTKIGESVSQTVYVTLKNISEFPALADDLGSKVSGISFFNVSFDSTQKIVAGKSARALAYQNALEKAEQYAKQAGLTVTRPISINEGYVSYASASYKRAYAEDAVMAMATAAPEPTYGTQTPMGLLSASVNVNVTFELK